MSHSRAGLSRVELFERIRRERRLDPSVSGRTLSKMFRVSRRTVAKALAGAVPPARKPLPARASMLDPAAEWIDAMLRADLSAPRKQRHTVTRIQQRLVAEHDFDVASYSAICKYVAKRREAIRAEAVAGAGHLEGNVPQEHAPGAEAEVDFADVWVRVAGVRTKCLLFTLRLSYSGKAVHRVFASGSQEAFMEGHVEAFRVLGGVPTRHIRYDNLRAAVSDVCFGGRNRVESARWVTFRSHYGFDAFYCLPGIEGAHEKGGVEQDGGRFRRTHLVPLPECEDLTELNDRLARIDAAEDARVMRGRRGSVGAEFAAEQRLLAPLPAEEFDCGLTLISRVSKTSRITVRQCYYSVPARFIGRQVRVSLRANELWVFDGAAVVARHPRLKTRFAYRDVLDHYLEILTAKPGALAGSVALRQAREEGVFTVLHDTFWEAAIAAHGRPAGTRALIEVLLLHRNNEHDAVLAGIAAALHAGSTSPQLVAIEARNHVAGVGEPASSGPGGEPEPDEEAGPLAEVIRLPNRRALPVDDRPLPDVSVYDQLLTRRPREISA